MHKIRYHLHMFFLNELIVALNLHRPIVATELTSWIFFIFWLSKIRVSPTDIVSSLSPPRCNLSFSQHHHATVPCHTSFPWSQDDLIASASSSINASSYRLPSWVKTKALNPHRHRWPPSSNNRLSPSTAIKRSPQPWSLSPPLNRVFILPPP
jgi:hypothetical protein